MTGSGGSGILIARKSDGTWSPPSGIMLHTPTLSFIIGVDVYDCVLVVTNLSALESITRPRVTLGEDVTLKNGPSVPMDSDDVNFNWKDLDHTVLAYMKARGQHQAVNLQGCILTERANENERFYGTDASQMDILAGNVARHVEETKPLFEVIKMAEGRTDFDKSVIEQTAIEPAPGDAVIATPKSTPASPRPSFGIPKADDPDPFGVLALEMAGLEIREAGTHLRPASSQFEINSNPRSPTLSKFGRQSIDTFVSKSNRASVMSSRTVKSQVTDVGTQTDVGTGNTPETTPSPGQSEDGHERTSVERMAELKEDDEVDYTTVDLTPLRHLSQEHSIDLALPEEPAIPPRNKLRTSMQSSRNSKEVEQPSKPTIAAAVADKDQNTNKDKNEDELEYDTNDADDEDDLDDSDEEPVVVFEVAQVQPTRTRAVASRMIHAKGSVVTIPKRIPPPLPTRSPARNSRSIKSEIGVETATVLSPLRQAFSEADLRADEEKAQEDAQAQRNSAGIETSKSADLGLIQSKSVDNIEPQNDMEVAEATTEEPQVDHSTQVTPSIDAVLVPGSFPGGEASEEVEKDLAVHRTSPFTTGEETTFKVDRNVEHLSPEDVPLPDDTDAESLMSRPEEIESEYASIEERATEDDESIKTPIDNSDSATSKKHTSSIYTGLTEDRWSIDRSSLTTPTSDRPVSVAEYSTEEDTPKKAAKEAKLEAEKHEQKQAAGTPLETPSEATITSA